MNNVSDVDHVLMFTFANHCQTLARVPLEAIFRRGLRANAARYLATARQASCHAPRIPFEDLDFADPRFRIFRADQYKRFIVDAHGCDRDKFGRLGRRVPRGCVMYFDAVKRQYVKVFDAYFCDRGDGHFLPEALRSGLFEFLCPSLSYILIDGKGQLRGYATNAGKTLTKRQFDRFVSQDLRAVICTLTERTGLYFYDLVPENVVLQGGHLSVIDLESVLPITWFGQDIEFARRHLHEIDIGKPLQTKFKSPQWYREFLTTLVSRSGEEAA